MGVIGLENLPEMLAAQERRFSVENLDVQLNSLEVKLAHGCLDGYVRLDGRDVRGVQKISIECEVFKLPSITLTIIDTPTPKASGG